LNPKGQKFIKNSISGRIRALCAFCGISLFAHRQFSPKLEGDPTGQKRVNHRTVLRDQFAPSNPKCSIPALIESLMMIFVVGTLEEIL